ncbi:uncharacterized protein LOC133824068 [Humulus lupulus]|uniref:uncharacterized protein LOC133824068 n=1 Tax=Humulus lupulus TaxID=3486 RepID=UPI002B406CBE|nr:uncharacterized protein LOC133824068 [Humulus lupulus]
MTCTNRFSNPEGADDTHAHDPQFNEDPHSSMADSSTNLRQLDQPTHEVVSNPYFLSSRDHPGLILVSKLLTDSNFQSWKMAIFTALPTKNKTVFIDGTLSKPNASNPLFSSWTKCNNMVMSWMLHSISFDITQSIMFFDLASNMWNDLTKYFNQGNGPRIFELKTNLQGLHQGDHSVTSYYTKLKSMWDELKEFQPAPHCSCGALMKFSYYFNQEKVLQFLTGLNES